MINAEEVITRSKQITELGVEIQKAYAMQSCKGGGSRGDS